MLRLKATESLQSLHTTWSYNMTTQGVLCYRLPCSTEEVFQLLLPSVFTMWAENMPSLSSKCFGCTTRSTYCMELTRDQHYIITSFLHGSDFHSNRHSCYQLGNSSVIIQSLFSQLLNCQLLQPATVTAQASSFHSQAMIIIATIISTVIATLFPHSQVLVVTADHLSSLCCHFHFPTAILLISPLYSCACSPDWCSSNPRPLHDTVLWMEPFKCTTSL